MNYAWVGRRVEWWLAQAEGPRSTWWENFLDDGRNTWKMTVCGRSWIMAVCRNTWKKAGWCFDGIVIHEQRRVWWGLVWGVQHESQVGAKAGVRCWCWLQQSRRHGGDRRRPASATGEHGGGAWLNWRVVFYGNHWGSTSSRSSAMIERCCRYLLVIELPYLLVLRFRKLARLNIFQSSTLLISLKIQKMININFPFEMNPCSRDKGSSSAPLIITHSLALYLRYFSSGWIPTRNLRFNTRMQKYSSFLS